MLNHRILEAFARLFACRCGTGILLVFHGRDAHATRRDLCVLALVMLATPLLAQRLTIDTFTLRAPTDGGRRLALGDTFEVSLRVKNRDAGTLTFVLRTVEPIKQEDAPPVLSHYDATRRFASMTETNRSVQMIDGGSRDHDPAPNAFRLRVSTADWKPGRYELGLFAHNSTDKRHGQYEAVCAKFAVVVEDGTVRLIDRYNPAQTRIRSAAFLPDAVRAGDPTALTVVLTATNMIGLKATTALRMAPENTLPGFRYDETSRKAFLAEPGSKLVLDQGALDTDPAHGAIRVPLRTDGLKPGLHFVTIEAHTDEGHPDTRRIALRIKDPADRLHVTVSEPWEACKGSSAGRFTRLPDGTLIYGGRISNDRGRTWTRPESGGIVGGCPVLHDGRVIALDYSLLPIDGRPGVYTGTLRSTVDGGKTVMREPAECRVPLAKAARGHAQHRGPLCTGSFVQRADGVLLALMMGWFAGDDALCPHGHGRPYSRSYVCTSSDGGRVWEYLATIGYDTIGSEGYNEGTLALLDNGEIVAVLRTGNMTDIACQDNPVMVTRSADGGRTWKKPWRTGVNGAYPVVTALSDGRLALSAGRPGAYVLFSSDRGDTWHDLTLVDPGDHSGYTALIETVPGEILVAFGEGYLRTDIKNNVRMTHVRYREAAH